MTYGKYAVRGSIATGETTLARWPANVVHDGSEKVVGMFPETPGQQGALTGAEPSPTFSGAIYGKMARTMASTPRNDTGSAARFFYTAKASPAEREHSSHPTQKPLALMRLLVRLCTPPSGLVLDPFLGSGTTAVACIEEGMRCLGIERETEYITIARQRLLEAIRQGDLFSREEAAQSVTPTLSEPQCTLFPPLSE